MVTGLIKEYMELSDMWLHECKEGNLVCAASIRSEMNALLGEMMCIRTGLIEVLDLT